MSAWDTTKNTASVSFTDSYGTAILQPSGSDQFAFGFFRNNGNAYGRQYFELHIRDVGGDPTDLHLGFVFGKTPNSPSTPPNDGNLGVLNNGDPWGGEQYTYLNHSLTVHGGTTVTPYQDGDVLMFMATWETDKSYRNVSNSVVGTAGGAGDFTAWGISYGKNGVWELDPEALFIKYPAIGYYAWLAPFAARTPTSTSSAVIALKVTTASFAYPLPSGAVAWGDGPQGGGAAVQDTDIKWSLGAVDTSLSASNHVAVFAPSGASNTFAFIYSTNFPTSGKRMVELMTRQDATTSTLTASTTLGSNAVWWGLADSTESTMSQSYSYKSEATSLYTHYGATDAYARGVTITHTNEMPGVYSYANQFPLTVLMDLDNSRYWVAGSGAALPASNDGIFYARDGANPNPLDNAGGFTFTNSVGVKLFWIYNKTIANGTVEINGGYKSFAGFPLLPGWKSMDGSREAVGTTTKWNTYTPTSLSVQTGSSDLWALYEGQTANHVVVMGTTTKYSGKQYFELYWGAAVATEAGIGGIRNASADTVTAATVPPLVDDALVVNIGSSRTFIRYGTSVSYSMTITGGSANPGHARYGFAVDFDAGNMWIGQWDAMNRRMVWNPGADPATGTLPDMTFTASTTMKIIGEPSPNLGGIILIAEDANVVGIPTGFSSWGGSSIAVSATATPSGGTASGVLWPYGVQT